MSAISLPWSMEQDRINQIKANSTHVDDNFNTLLGGVNNKLDVDGTSTPTADISWAGHRLTNLATPTVSGDASTKGYVDSLLVYKAPLDSPMLTGTPTAPTVASVGDNSTKIATTEFVMDMLKALYPVGAVYIGEQNTCPLAAFFGTWTKVEGRYLLASGTLAGTSESYLAGTDVAAGAPNITGNNAMGYSNAGVPSGAFKKGANTSTIGSGAGQIWRVNFDASASNAIYGASTTVRAPARVMNVWVRTA